MHGFAVLRMSIPRTSQKMSTSSETCDVNMTFVFALEAAFLKRLHATCFYAQLQIVFDAFSPKFSSEKMFYAITAIKQAFLLH